MAEEIFISIIIPTYNSEQTISTALHSILTQTFTSFEILVIDNLSVDNTRQLATGFNDHRIKFFCEEDNGIYDAMNKGICLAKGKWIYFLGSDDKYNNPSILELISRTLAKTTSELVYGNVLVAGESYWAKHNSVYDGIFTVEKLFTKNICHQAIFYSKELFDRLGYFNTDYKVCADWDFNHRCFANVRTEYVNEVVAVFSGGGKSTKTIADKFTLLDSVINLKKYYHLSYTNPLFKRYAMTFLRNAKNYLTTKKMDKSIYFFLLSLFHSNNRIYFIKNYVLALYKKMSGASPHSN